MEAHKIITELIFKAVRSSGAGGQNVNKVSSKIVLSFAIDNSNVLSDEEKGRLIINLSSRLSAGNVLILNCDEDRSQFRNKEIVIKRFLQLISKALLVPKIRKATKTPKSVIRKRLRDKKNVSDTKQLRRKPGID